MKKLLLVVIPLVVIALAVILTLAIFEGKPSPRDLTVGYIPIADCAQLYVAIEKGYFQDEGLTVTLIPLAGGAKILEALSAGSVDVGFSNVVSLVLARAAGLRIIALTGGPVEDRAHAEHAILVRRGSGIEGPQDLQGKVIALNTRKNIDELFVRRYLELHGIDVTTVTFLEVPFPKMESVLLTGDVDAIAAIEPFVTFALQRTNVSVLGYNYVELEERIEISSYDVLEPWLAENPNVAAAFKRAIDKATEYIWGHEPEVRGFIAKHTKLDPTQATQITLPTFSKSLSENALNQRIGELIQLGWLEKPVDASVLIYR